MTNDELSSGTNLRGENPLERIAAALEALAPRPAIPDDPDGPACFWDGTALFPLPFTPLALDLLTGIEAQKLQLLENTRRLANGSAAHDALLWGARGAGKSALAKAVIGAVQSDSPALMLVDVGHAALSSLGALAARLAKSDRPTIVFIDDLGFDHDIRAARELRSMLEGGSAARPQRVKFYVTSNRRHIVARDMTEQDSAINVRDVVDDRMALADRFGLSLGFHVVDQDSYLSIVARYAEHFHLDYSPRDAVAFAVARGSRSGRVAWHFIVELAGAAGRAL